MKLSSLCCVCLTVIFLLGVQCSVSAEVYKFTDANGETHYTNDPASVPRQYRDGTDVEGEIGSYSYSDEVYTSDETYDEEADMEETGDVEQHQGNSGEATGLQARQDAFDKEFKALEEEKDRLDKAMKKAETRDEREEINAQIQQFNNSYKDFHLRLKDFKQKVKEHNEQVRQEMERSLKKYKERQASQDDE